MADARMNIVITAVNEAQKVLEDAAAKISALGKGLEALGVVSAKKAEDGLISEGKALKESVEGHQKLQDGVGKLSKGFEKLVMWVKLAAGGFLAFESVRIIKHFADVSARAEELGIVLNAVGRNAGLTSYEIEKTDRSVQAIGITASAARQSLSQFIESGLDISKATELARTAQNLAVVSGENSSQTFQRMIGSIQTLDTLSLRFMGITVDNERAQNIYALSLGRSATTLTEIEKRQALMNAVQLEGHKLNGLYAESMTSVGKQMGSLARFIEEAQRALASNLLPAYLAIVEELSKFLAAMTLVGDKVNSQGEGAEKLGNVVRGLAHAFFSLIEWLVENWKWIVTLIAAYEGMRISLLLFQGAMAVFAASQVIASFVTGLLDIAKAGAVMNAMLTGGIGLLTAAVGIAAVWWGISKMQEGMAPKTQGDNSIYSMDASKLISTVNDQMKTTEDIRDQMSNMKDKGGQEYIGLENKYEEAVKARQRTQQEMLRKHFELEREYEKHEHDAKGAYYKKELELLREYEEKVAKPGKERTDRENKDIAIQDAQKALGLSKFSLVDATSLSVTSSAAVIGYSRMLDDFVVHATTAGGAVSVSFLQIREAMLGMLTQAKTVDDFTAVLEQLGNSAVKLNTLKTTMSELARTVWVNREKEEVKELDAVMAGYNEKLKEIHNVQNAMLITSNLAYKGQMEMVKVQAQLAFNERAEYAATRNELNAQIVEKKQIYERDMADLEDSTGRKKAVILEDSLNKEKNLQEDHDNVMLAAAKERDDAIINKGSNRAEAENKYNIFARNADEKLEVGKARLTTDTNRQILDNENETNKQKLDMANKYYKELNQLSDQYLQDYKRHAQAVIAADDKVREYRDRFNRDTRAANESLMSGLGAYQDKKKELRELESQGDQMAMAGRTKEAEKYYNQQYSLAASLANAPGVGKFRSTHEATAERQRATEKLMDVEKQEGSIQKEAANASMAKYQETLASLDQLQAKVKGLGMAQIVRITPELNSNTLWSQVNSVVEKIHDKFSKGLDMSVRLGNGAIKKFVDEIQSYLDNNPVKLALQNYAGQVANIGKLAPAGISAAPSFAESEGSPRSVGGDQSTLNLIINRNPIGAVSGNRGTLDSLINTLKDVARGGGNWGGT